MKVVLFIFFSFIYFALPAQRINTSFGKNRVQFHKDYNEWRKYESAHFTSYWYGRAKDVANFTVDVAEEEYEEIRQLMEYRLNEKIELLIFTDLTDLKQSNIGDSDVFVGKEGETTVFGNKIMVYYDGNHKHLYHSIRSGIAEVFLNQMYIGSNIKEFIKNKFVLNVPNWYKGGLVSYIGSRWNADTEKRMSELFLEEEREDWDFYSMTESHPNEIGHSFWYFIDQTYGRSTISNILYLTRIYKNSEEAFLFELGTEFKYIIEEWKQFYKNYFNEEIVNTYNNLDINDYLLRTKKGEKITTIALSPRKDKLLYCRNNIGKYKVVIQGLNTNKKKTIFKFGYRNHSQEPDYNYPLLTWDSDQFVTIVYEKRDVLYLRKINIADGTFVEQIVPRAVQRIYSISKYEETSYIVTASMNGYSNLYVYDMKKRRFKALTEESADHLEAIYINDAYLNGIVFLSTRNTPQETIIKEDNNYFNIFFMDFNQEEKPITKMDEYNTSDQKRIKYLGGGKIGFLSDKTGINQQFILDLLSKDSKLVSNNKSDILDSEINFSKNKLYQIIYRKEREYIISNTSDWTSKHSIARKFKALQSKVDNKIEKEEIIPEGMFFVTKFKAPEKTIKKETGKNGVKKKHQFNFNNITGARLAFRLDDYSFDYNNDILFEGLETYIEDQNNRQFLSNGGFLLKANTTDLFENYNIEAGIRIPTRLNGNEVYLVVEDRKRLIDREYIIYRKSKKYTLEEGSFSAVQRTKKISLLGMMRWKYPFDIYRSLRLSTSYNIEKYFYLSIDNKHYDDPILNDKRIALKLEYIFDNTIQKGINILHGTRYKFYTEAINKFDIQIFDNPTLDLNTGHSFVFGVDARNYFPLGQNAVFASRFAAFTSLGSEKILYQLGGVENWLNPSFNANNTYIGEDDFAYKYNVANLRGFSNNARNGNSAALGSLELRVSPFKYFSKKRIRSSFFRNFQIDLFYDIGTAWYGFSPFDDNPINEVHISQPPIFEIDITYHRDPLIMGYGLGLRTTLLGTLLRIDYAWGIESGIVQKPILYFALGTDF